MKKKYIPLRMLNVTGCPAVIRSEYKTSNYVKIQNNNTKLSKSRNTSTPQTTTSNQEMKFPLLKKI